MKKLTYQKTFILIFTFFLFSCSDDDNSSGCSEDQAPVFVELEGLLLVEAEAVDYGEGWRLVRDLSDATGSGYMRWEGENQNNNPGVGLATFNLEISTAGTYRFIWRSAVTEGDNPTEANDSWLRFPDADDYFGERNNGSIVYPKGTGKTPNPNGSSKDGWFKIYRSGTPLDFKWQAKTSDNDAHDIYVTFESAGVYTMEISGRSAGHAIDKFVLYLEDLYSEQEATESIVFSEVSCR
ncbi:MAG: hypothetical protein AAFY41_00870 [Bacteroidota bacterium]